MSSLQFSRRSILLGTGASLASLARRGSAPAALTEVVSAPTWTIGNDQVERTIRFDPLHGLFTEQLSGLKPHRELIHPEAVLEKPPPEFSFVCDGQHYRGSSSAFSLVHADAKKLPNGKLLTILLRATKTPLEVAICYVVYDGHPALRKWLLLRNVGSTTLHLSHLNIESIAPSFGPSNETFLNAQYGAVPREIFYTGRSEDAGLLLCNARTGDGLAILSEVP